MINTIKINFVLVFFHISSLTKHSILPAIVSHDYICVYIHTHFCKSMCFTPVCKNIFKVIHLLGSLCFNLVLYENLK